MKIQSHSNPTDLYPLSLLEHAQTDYNFKDLSFDVRQALEKASSSQLVNEPQKKALVIDPTYQLAHLSKKSLLELHKILSSYHEKKGTSSPFFAHLFDIEDHIFRHVLVDPKSSGREYKQLLPQDSPLVKKIDDLMKNGSRFYRAEMKGTSPNKWSDWQVTEKINPVNSKKPLKVLKLCLENSRNFSGGITAVVAGLAAAHKKLRSINPICSKVYSIAPMYEKDKSIGHNFKFQGIVPHVYEDRLVHSSIYKNKKTLEYLVQPDPSLPRLFNTPTAESPYSDGMVDRSLYLGSAAAAFAAFYKGKTGDRQVQILQCEGLPVLMTAAFSLFRSIYLPIRKSYWPKEFARTIGVWHHGNVGYKAKYHPKQLEPLRKHIPLKEKEKIEPVTMGLLLADKVVYVSKDVAARAVNPDPQINHGQRSSLLAPNKVVSILNGIETDKFDPTDTSVFKSLALKRTFDFQGKETTDYMAYRQKLKKLLFEAHLLKSPDLPLLIFVGRYREEKGIDMLANVIQDFPFDMQFVSQGEGPDPAVERLKTMEATSHKEKLQLFTTLKAQNTEFCHQGKRYGVPIGLLLRAAADFLIVPSYFEACGLVAMEGQCSGALLIAPFHQGLKEICLPDGYTSPAGEIYSLDRNANAICYNNPFSSSEAIEAVIKAFSIWAGKTKKQRNDLAIRIRNEAVAKYGWYSLDPEKRHLTGGAISYDHLYHEMAEREKPSQGYLLKDWRKIPIAFQHSIQNIEIPSDLETPSWSDVIPKVWKTALEQIFSFF